MSNSGRQEPSAGHPDEMFWQGLAENVVQFPRCGRCGTWVWPARATCPTCVEETLVWTTVDPVGVVYSWTRTFYPFSAGHGEEIPYVVALVQLHAAGDIRVLGLMVDGPQQIEIGDKVTGTIVAPAETTLGLPSLRWEH